MSLEFAEIINLFHICSFRYPDIRNIRWEQERVLEYIRHKKRVEGILSIENELCVIKADWSQALKGISFGNHHLYSLNILNIEFRIEMNFVQVRKLLALFKNLVQVSNIEHLIVLFFLIILTEKLFCNFILSFLLIYSWKFKRNQLLSKDLDKIYH